MVKQVINTVYKGSTNRNNTVRVFNFTKAAQLDMF